MSRKITQVEAQDRFPVRASKPGPKIVSWFYRQNQGPFAGFVKPDLPQRDELLTTWRTSSEGGETEDVEDSIVAVQYTPDRPVHHVGPSGADSLFPGEVHEARLHPGF